MLYYAHTGKNSDKSDWQLLKEHLNATAKRGGIFAEKFNHKEFGRIVGLLHDLGKYSDKFQKRLQGANIRVDHSTAGAKESAKLSPPFGENILTYCVAGHHGGLPDTKDLLERVKNKTVEDYSVYINEFSEEELNIPLAFKFNDINEKQLPFSISFLTRMLYSCLVDADYLDTEEFMADKEIIRSDFESLDELYEKLQKRLDEFGTPTGHINIKRNEILQECLKKAEQGKGLYSLTVPTGGGKTLSSLAFAIKHAIKNNQDRIIYAIPYTSIIEQNAEVFRGIFGNENVLEHHSNYIFEEKEDNENCTTSQKLKYASENWDAPIIATTNVQFFESLFANKKSRCRKLHNIANSVIILDEAQMIPAKYLIPCTKAIEELVARYNCTVVLCTATQPPLEEKFFSLAGREIMPDPQELFKAFKRVNVKNIGKKADDELVEEISGLEQVLVIVNTKKHAFELYKKLAPEPKEEVFHLSTFMCPAHRKKILDELKGTKDKDGNVLTKGRLKEGKPTKVISTQLIEAGVDIDFPYVYRSSAGLDSIAQSAGRCNREGRQETGFVRVFESKEKHGMPHGSLKLPAQLGRAAISKFSDLLSMEAISHYFNELFFYRGDEQLGLKFIKENFKMYNRGGFSFEFRTAAKEFNFINQNTFPVVVPLDDDDKANELVKKLKYDESPKKYLRQLQPYTVSLYEQDYIALVNKGSIEQIGDITAVLLNTDKNYDNNTGIIINKESEAFFA